MRTKSESQRLINEKRINNLDQRIKRKYHYPTGPLALVQGLSRIEDPGPGKMPDRVTNKIQIEELLRLRKNNNETTYLDATLGFIKIRGSDHGMKLT